MPHQHRVEPAATALPAGDGAELVPALAEALAVGIVELGRERPGTDAGGVGLDDAEHEPGRVRPQSAAARDRAADGVRAGDERISAVVHVEQHALRAFEQDAAAGLLFFVETAPDRLRELLHERRDFLELLQQFRPVDRRLVEPGPQRIVVRAKPVEQRLQLVQVRQIAHPDRPAADLVLVSRADPTPGRADLALARRRFAQHVEFAVERQDQRAIVGDGEVRGRDRHALPFEPLDFRLQGPGIEHHAVADQAQRAGDDARRQQRELVGGVADHQRVPGVVPALEAHDHVGPARQPVDDLALAFIAPLGADHGDVGQALVPFRKQAARP